MDLKPISFAGIPTALQKAERYRLLNDSSCAESICLDVLAVDPTNQQALIMLVLAITDQFTDELTEGVQRARQVLPMLRDEYKRAYYAGIICERRAKAQLHQRGLMGTSEVAADWFRQAMTHYEEAERLRPTGNDESILRWNTCARMLAKYERPVAAGEYEPVLED
jgi:hypothetical protein